MLARRDFLVTSAGACASAGLLPPPWMTALQEDTLDAAFERFQSFGPTYGRGASNHGPMAVEALAAMGAGSAIAEWIQDYTARLDPAPAPGEPIAAENWSAVLGAAGRYADWDLLFRREIEEHGAADTLQLWLPRFVHDVGCYAFHGAIRAGHAARALAAHDSAPRRRELAAALAFWASRCDPPPTPSGADEPGERLPLPQCLTIVENAVPDTDAPNGSVMAGIRRVAARPGFIAAAARADLGGEPADTAQRIGALFARTYLEHGGDARIGYIHAITGPVALRRLVPWLDEESVARGLRSTWTACAAIHAAFRTDAHALPDGKPPSREQVVAAAVASGDEHAIKFTEALLDLDAAGADAIFFHAAADASAEL